MRKIDIKPIDDLGYFLKRWRHPFQAHEFRAALIGLFLPFYYVPLCMGLIFATFTELVVSTKTRGLGRRIKDFGKGMLDAVSTLIWGILQLVVLPIRILHFFTRCVIHLFADKEPDPATTLKQAIFENDITTVRNWPRHRDVFQTLLDDTLANAATDRVYPVDYAVALGRKEILSVILREFHGTSYRGGLLGMPGHPYSAWKTVCRTNDVELARVFLDSDEECAVQFTGFNTVIYHRLGDACKAGAEDIVNEILTRYPPSTKSQNTRLFNDKIFVDYNQSDIDYLFSCAAKGGSIAIFEALIRQAGFTPSDLNVKSNILHDACRNGHIALFKALVQQGYPIHTDENEHSLLYSACLSGSLELVQCLIHEHQLNPEHAKVHRQTQEVIGFQAGNALLAACTSGSTELVRVLIEDYHFDPSWVGSEFQPRDGNRQPMQLPEARLHANALQACILSKSSIPLVQYLLSVEGAGTVHDRNANGQSVFDQLLRSAYRFDLDRRMFLTRNPQNDCPIVRFLTSLRGKNVPKLDAKVPDRNFGETTVMANLLWQFNPDHPLLRHFGLQASDTVLLNTLQLLVQQDRHLRVIGGLLYERLEKLIPIAPQLIPQIRQCIEENIPAILPRLERLMARVEPKIHSDPPIHQMLFLRAQGRVNPRQFSRSVIENYEGIRPARSPWGTVG